MRHRKVLLYLLLAILAGAFIFLTQSSQENNKASSAKEIAGVLRVIDGDTIEVDLNNKTERIRLIGIDTPEILDERKPVQCFGKEASDRAKKVLTDKTIELESDPTQENKDEYGRLLRYVFLDDLNFNKLMIAEGYAHEFTFRGSRYKYQSEFAQAEKEARENKIGLWLECEK